MLNLVKTLFGQTEKKPDENTPLLKEKGKNNLPSGPSSDLKAKDQYLSSQIKQTGLGL